jgi:hypothetical protein
MLDLQRQKYASGETSGSVVFTRRLIFGHIVSGLLALALLVFHECFGPAAWVGAWYLISLILIIITMKQQSWARFLVALIFTAGAGAGFYGLIWLLPAYRPAQAPLLPLSILPLWVTLFSLAYVGAAYLWAVSKRVKRASERGINLLDTPAPY